MRRNQKENDYLFIEEKKIVNTANKSIIFFYIKIQKYTNI